MQSVAVSHAAPLVLHVPFATPSATVSLQVSLVSEPQVLDAFVPPFILQPLVENAVRYAVSVRSCPTRVEIKAWRHNGHVRVRVRDDGPGLPAGWSFDSHAGIGLASIRERLRHLYGPDRHSFDVTPEPGGGRPPRWVRTDFLQKAGIRVRCCFYRADDVPALWRRALRPYFGDPGGTSLTRVVPSRAFVG